MIQISIVNKSTIFPDARLPILANAIAIQMTRDFYPIWGFNPTIFFTPSGSNPHPDHWALFLMDDATQAGELGVHDVTPTGQPLGQAFVKTSQADGVSIESVVSHEITEMGGDSRVNLSAQIGSILYAYEAADAVENQEYNIIIPAGWDGAGTVIPVSNFVTPNWFQPGSAGPFDFLNKTTAPLELTPGGYIGFFDMNNPSAGWQQKTARTDPAAIMRARPRAGSRRALRATMLAPDKRIRSIYEPGSEAVLAGAKG